MAERIGVVSYLSERTNAEGDRELVVRQVRLRGEPSFGLVVRLARVDSPHGSVLAGGKIRARIRRCFSLRWRK
ncbi:MAG TPA: hypothetical protein VEW48_18510 [Thermoanaerobaculia bacterium]|nr:hypothetical protein [Thermoanaerobaculia bacterium]